MGRTLRSTGVTKEEDKNVKEVKDKKQASRKKDCKAEENKLETVSSCTRRNLRSNPLLVVDGKTKSVTPEECVQIKYGRKSSVLKDKTNKSPTIVKSNVTSRAWESKSSPFTVKKNDTKSTVDANVMCATAPVESNDVDKHSKHCIYSTVQRDSPFRKVTPTKKLEQYEFEVDENEPVIKKKKKRKPQKRKKLDSSDEFVLPKRTQKLHHANVKSDLKRPLSRLHEQNQDKSENYVKILTSVNTELSNISNRTSNETYNAGSSELQQKFLENTANKSTNGEQHNKNISVISSVNNSFVTVMSENSLHQNAPLDKSNTLKPEEACENHNKDEQSLSNTNYVQSEVCSPGLLGTKVCSRIKRQDASISHVSTKSFHFQKHYIAPRVSGGLNYKKNDVSESWDIKNCFGFEEENEEIHIMSPARKAFSEDIQSLILTKAVPLCSTPLYKSIKNVACPTRFRAISKEKKSNMCEKTNSSLLSMEQSTPQKSHKPEECSKPVSQNSLYSTETLVQSTIDFVNHKKNPTKPAKIVSFLDADQHDDSENDDTTPSHFNKPPRRSYERPYRKKKILLFDDWVEVDDNEGKDESYKPDEEKKKSKKKKKHEQSTKEKILANKWAKEFNSFCEEVDDFELCVE